MISQADDRSLSRACDRSLLTLLTRLAWVVTRRYHVSMKTVGMHELKNHPSAYVRLVRARERVLITDHGEVVAELRPPEPIGREAMSYPGLHELVQQGKARPGAPNAPSLYPPRPVRTPDGTAARLIDAERGER
jgi:antitoxin (DNA-binding transcriptional repressor) of toxin-antitoxin stability system